MTVQPIPATELAALQPPSQAERHKRAMFMAAQTGRLSIQLIRKCLSHCDTIDFDGRGPVKQRLELKNFEHFQAMKEISALCIWLALAEQLGGGMPEWLKVFFADTWACSDMLLDTPTSKEVLAWYPATRDLNDTCQTAALRMCHNLHMGDTINDAVIFFAATLMEASQARASILSDALKKPIDELHKIIAQPVAV